MSARLISGLMFRQQGCQPDRFLTKFLLDQVIAARCFVAFVEKQVERLQHSVQPARQFLANWYLKRNVLVADLLFGPCQSLGNSRFAG